MLVGTCSWSDATLVKESDWYPRRSMTAAERLAFYANRFPVVEVESTYYFPPTPAVAASWVERTPASFTMDVKAYSLLTGHPTLPQSLWPDLQGEVPAEHRDKRRLYAGHLPPEVLDEAWARYLHAIGPLRSAGRLGAVLLGFPRWFGPNEVNREQIRLTAHRLGDVDGCVEFHNARWLEGSECERTLELLEETGLSFVCGDGRPGSPSTPPAVVAATSPLAVVRFHGRSTGDADPGEWGAGPAWAARRFHYLYTEAELREWVPRVHELASSAREVHLLMNNCWRDEAVSNAADLVRILAETGRPAPEATARPAPGR